MVSPPPHAKVSVLEKVSPDAALTAAGRPSRTVVESAVPRSPVSIVSFVIAQLAPKVVVMPSTTSDPLSNSPVALEKK